MNPCDQFQSMLLEHLYGGAVAKLSLVQPDVMLGLLMGGSVIYWFTGASTQAVVTGAYRAVVYIKENMKLDAATALNSLRGFIGKSQLHAIDQGCWGEERQYFYDKLVEMAKEGDVAAARLVLSYTVGKPTEAVDPDRLDVEEFSLHGRSIARR